MRLKRLVVRRQIRGRRDDGLTVRRRSVVSGAAAIEAVLIMGLGVRTRRRAPPAGPAASLRGLVSWGLLSRLEDDGKSLPRPCHGAPPQRSGRASEEAARGEDAREKMRRPHEGK